MVLRSHALMANIKIEEGKVAVHFVRWVTIATILIQMEALKTLFFVQRSIIVHKEDQTVQLSALMEPTF